MIGFIFVSIRRLLRGGGARDSVLKLSGRKIDGSRYGIKYHEELFAWWSQNLRMKDECPVVLNPNLPPSDT